MQHYSATVVYKDPASGDLKPDTGVSVEVRDNSSGSLITLYQSDESTTQANPIVVSDSDQGFFEFWCPANRVNIIITADNASRTLTNVALYDNRLTATGGTVTRETEDRYSDFINVMDHGATGDGSTDDTAAIQSALDYAETFSKKKSVYLPPGNYRVAELRNDGKVLMVGDEVGYTELTYNGAGGTDSAVLRVDGVGGSPPNGGIENIRIDGYNPDSGAFAWYGYWISGGLGWDRAFRYRNIYIENCQKIGLKHDGQVVNMHLQGVLQWGPCGEWPIEITGNAGQESRVLTIDKFTWDNTTSQSGVIAAMEAANSTTGTGYGFIKIATAGGISATIANARIELNEDLRVDNSNVPCFFHFDHNSGNNAALTVQNVVGYFQSTTAGIIAYLPNGKVTTTLIRSNVQEAQLAVYDASLGTTVPPSQKSVICAGNRQTERGMWLDSASIIPIEENPESASNLEDAHTGTLYLDAWQTGVPKRMGWMIAGNGFSQPGNRNLFTNVSMTATQNTFTISANQSEWAAIGRNVTIPGAGAAAADLETRITAYNYSTNTVTVANSASTTVSGVTVTNTRTTFSPAGDVYLIHTEVIDLPSVAAGAYYETADITITGAQTDHYAQVNADIDTQGLRIGCRVKSSNTVRVEVENPTAGAIDLASCDFHFRFSDIGQ